MEKLSQLLGKYSDFEPITEESSLKLDLGLSSFDIINLLIDLETELHVSISLETILQMQTAGEVASCLRERGAL